MQYAIHPVARIIMDAIACDPRDDALARASSLADRLCDMRADDADAPAGAIDAANAADLLIRARRDRLDGWIRPAQAKERAADRIFDRYGI
jgi:hypothetical protein